MEQIRATRNKKVVASVPILPQPHHGHHATKEAPKTRKTVNINGIFDYQKKVPSPEKHPRNVLSARPATVKKVYARNRKPGFFATLVDNMRKHEEAATDKPHKLQGADSDFFTDWRAKATRMSLGVVETVEPFVKGRRAKWRRQVAQDQRALEAARMGLDIDGKPTTKPGVPTPANFAEIEQQLKEVDIPVDDCIVNLRFTSGDGLERIKTMRIGDIKTNFFERFQQQRALVGGYEEQLAGLMGEAKKLKEEIMSEGADVKKINKECEEKLAALDEELKQLEKQARNEYQQLEKEEKKTTREVNRKIQELWDSVQ